MPHYGDDHDWDGIDDCVSIIGKTLRFWRFPAFDYKEKYGYVRCYVSSFGYSSLHSLIYPRYYYSQFPQWIWNLSCYVFTSYGSKWYHKLWRWFIHIPTSRFHAKIYRHAYKKALKAHPELAKYILSDADCSQLLKGLVKESDCDHENFSICDKHKECSVCGKVFPKDD